MCSHVRTRFVTASAPNDGECSDPPRAHCGAHQEGMIAQQSTNHTAADDALAQLAQKAVNEFEAMKSAAQSRVQAADRTMGELRTKLDAVQQQLLDEQVRGVGGGRVHI